MPSSFRRNIAVVVLGLTLAAPCAWAAEVRSRSESNTVRHADSSSQGRWEFFSRIWSLLGNAWSKNGCSADPFGCPTQQLNTTASSDNGCSLDPDGRCGK
jgi:hypothetical protein